MAWQQSPTSTSLTPALQDVDPVLTTATSVTALMGWGSRRHQVVDTRVAPTFPTRVAIMTQAAGLRGAIA
ncbi:hypothetical protein [Mycobacterium shimoidei]|uniref:hypothetical protein n=1 Tax=Mycobacterium shimoidei TaxID=29313 RepID=UPI000848C56A|nr:hypothetical protein [Mycobacterium shimoidei]MCV7260177.1 hypothetical protein [Mycobacterium shimoidei]ODR05435.1 hypothetical protein BHQ16_22160 [Mycobacterium shimoidei]ORW81865.1 hypothetical protein AWC26_06695 [Mycobacterium shimoidei]